MEENLSQALLVMLVGMITVFVILSLVVLSGKVLIYIINGYFPMAPKKIKKERSRATANNPIKSMHPKKIAAILAAVESATGGRGTVTKIEKV